MGGWPERAAFRTDSSVGSLASDASVFRWGEVFLFAVQRGEWAPFERRLRARAALLESAEVQGCDEVVTAFRHARGLISADDTRAWLAAWGLDSETWERVLHAERLEAESDTSLCAAAVSDHEVAGALWAEAVCSSCATRFAEAFAGAVALAAEAPPGAAPVSPKPCPPLLRRWLGWPDHEIAARLARLAALDAASRRARRSSCGSDAVAAIVERQRLSWVRLGGVYAEFPKEGMAREARLRVQADGEPLARVAHEAGARAWEIRACLEDLPAELQPAASAGQPGDLLGPVRSGEGFTLLAVTSRAAADPADPLVRRRAEQALEADALARATHEHVRWEPPLREALG